MLIKITAGIAGKPCRRAERYVLRYRPWSRDCFKESVFSANQFSGSPEGLREKPGIFEAPRCLRIPEGSMPLRERG